MAKVLTNEEMLKKSNILFSNLEAEQNLASKMEEYGYNTAKVQEGKDLYEKANTAFLENITKIQEENSVSDAISKLYEEISTQYAEDRKKARIVFEDEEAILKNLGLKGRVELAKAKRVSQIKVFYLTIKNSNDLKQRVAHIKIDENYLNDRLSQVEKFSQLEVELSNKKGKRQSATEAKNKAITNLDAWIKKFQKYAKIAFKEDKQLLESLGIQVK